jgi:hypothetical protein
MATTTNYSWTTPDDTDLVKDGASAIRTLGSSADTTVKDLNPGTTAGDIDYYTSSTAKARIGIGTAGQILQVNSGATAPEWAAPASGSTFVGAKGKRDGSTQSIANATFTAVLFNAEYYDTDSIHSTSSNTDRFTVPTGKGGKWAISASVLFSGSSTGERRIAVYKNGAAANTDNRLSGQGSAGQTMAINSVFDLVATDYLSIYVYQDSSGSLNLDGDIIYCAFSYLGA